MKHSQNFILSSLEKTKTNVDIKSDQFSEFLTAKKGNFKGNHLKFTINFYHSTSSVLVNGNRVDIFENELFDQICSQIKGACTKLDIVNDKISSALSELDKNDSQN